VSRNYRRPYRRAPLESVTGFHEHLPQSAIDLFAADAASPDRDNREAPTCACGALVYADGLCVAHHEARLEARNRALPPEEQRD
jgi:hypothetical protein